MLRDNNKSTKRRAFVLTFFLLILIGLDFLNSNNFFSEDISYFDNQKDYDILNHPLPKLSNSKLWNYLTSDIVFSTAISSDGFHIVTGSDQVYYFNKTSSTPVWSNYTGSNINSVAISSNGSYIVAGDDNSIYLFHNSSSKPLWSNYTGSNINSVAISSNGDYIVAGNSDGIIYLFSKAIPTPIWSYNTGMGQIINSVAISSDGSYIAAGSDDNNIYLFNNTGPTPEWSYLTEGPVEAVAISSDGRYIAAGSDDNNVYLFNNTGPTPEWSYLASNKVFSVAISSNGSYIAAGSDDNNVYLFNNTGPTPEWSYLTEGPMEAVAISSDGRYIAAGSNDYKVYLFNNTDPTPMWSYLTEDIVGAVAMSSCGNYVVAGSNDMNIYLFQNTIPPSSFDLSSNAGTPDNDGNFDLTWTSSVGVDNYSVYEHSSYITKINGSLTSLIIETEDLILPLSGYLNGTYYFIVVANNTYGGTLSNCVEIVIEIRPPSNFILTSSAETPDDNGMFDLTWEIADGAQNYSVYMHNSFIYEIQGNGTLYSEDITELNCLISGLISGMYYFIVLAYNEEGVTSSNCISVFVQIPPGSFVLSSNADNPDTDGSYNLTWIESIGADNYTIYYSSNYITQINGSVDILFVGITDLNFLIHGWLNGNYYFKVVAYNETGIMSSNCLHIRIEIPSDTPPQNQDNSVIFLFILIVSLTVVSSGVTYSVIKQKKRKSSRKIGDKYVKSSLKTNKSSLTKLENTELSMEEKEELTRTESEVSVQKNEYACIVHRGIIKGNIYLCPKCQSFYCDRCAKVLKLKGEMCWSCGNEIEIEVSDNEKAELLEKK